MTRFFLAYVSDDFRTKKKFIKKLFFNVGNFLEIFFVVKFFFFNFFVVRIQKNTWAYVSDNFETNIFLNVGKIFNFFFAKISLFMGEGLRLFVGAVPLDPACYWIEDSSRNR